MSFEFLIMAQPEIDINILIQAAVNKAREDFQTEISALKNQLQLPTPAETYSDVRITRHGDASKSLKLIESLPDFDGNISSYPSWRASAKFCMEYYTEGTENYYVATGILRNKVKGSANTTLSAFNTVLHYKAIFKRLDQTYADTRPLHVLQNELNTLRQGSSSLTEFYDKVDRQLTLIVNKQIMMYSGQNEIIKVFNEQARDDALRVFISGLRRPLCDILFSAKPKDLANALVTAQELETNHKRYVFAKIFDSGKPTPSSSNPPPRVMTQTVTPKPVPMSIDPSTVKMKQDPQRFGAIRKHSGNNFDSTKSPLRKTQRLFHIPDSEHCSENVQTHNEMKSNDIEYSNIEQEYSSDSEDYDALISDNELNFLE